MRRRVLTPAEVEQARQANEEGGSEAPPAATLLGRLRVGPKAGEARMTAVPVPPRASGAVPIPAPKPQEAAASIPTDVSAMPDVDPTPSPPPPPATFKAIPVPPVSAEAVREPDRPPSAISRPRQARPLQARRIRRRNRPLRAERQVAVVEEPPAPKNPERKLPKRSIRVSNEVHGRYSMAMPPRR